MAGETVTPERGALVSQAGGYDLQVVATVNAETLAKREEALIRSKVFMARQFPRVIEDVERKLVHECKRPMLAERARYALPRRNWNKDKNAYETKTIVGWSIRFAEQAMRLFGNVEVKQLIVSEDRDLRVIEVQIIDYETMVSETRQIALNKTMERRKLNRDQEPIAERRNATTGEVIYIVPTSEADMLSKTNGQISRVKRGLILELIPPDVLYACELQVARTQADTDRKDPDAAKKRLVDAYSLLGVTAGQLVQYIGKPLADCGDVQLQELRGLYESLRSGDVTWDEVMTEKNASGTDTTAPVAPAADAKTPEAKPSPPKGEKGPVPFTFKDKPGSPELAQAVLAEIHFASATPVLKQLAPWVAKVGKDDKAAVEKAYEAKLVELQKAGK